MNINFFQSSHESINSVYVIRDFLDDYPYIDHIRRKIEEYTEVDHMNRLTNVKANMTDYKVLMNDDDFRKIHLKILEIIAFIYKIRTPHPDEPLTFEVEDSWGMRHKRGDDTKVHVHKAGTVFSAAYYLKTPPNIFMRFHDYDRKLELEENMLIIFPGLSKHSVEASNSDDYRISMAMNINMFDT